MVNVIVEIYDFNNNMYNISYYLDKKNIGTKIIKGGEKNE